MKKDLKQTNNWTSKICNGSIRYSEKLGKTWLAYRVNVVFSFQFIPHNLWPYFGLVFALLILYVWLGICRCVYLCLYIYIYIYVLYIYMYYIYVYIIYIYICIYTYIYTHTRTYICVCVSVCLCVFVMKGWVLGLCYIIDTCYDNYLTYILKNMHISIQSHRNLLTTALFLLKYLSNL